MPYTWAAQDDVEPIADSTIEGIANIATYNVISGCAQTYGAGNMQVTVAAGVVTHNGALVTVAGNTVTLVSDPTYSRWTYIGVNSGGTAVIVSGDPAATPSVPESGDIVIIGLALVQAGQTIAANITYKLDKRVIAPLQPTVKYNTATQVFTTTTTYADVIAAGTPATMSFAIGASEVWQATWYLPLTFGGTGGAKFQVTGPAAPTAVTITGRYATGDPAGANALSVVSTFAAVTAFSSDVASKASASAATVNTYVNNFPCFIEIIATIRNGSTAGTVTLQAAQNNANSTTTIGLGATLTARRMA